MNTHEPVLSPIVEGISFTFFHAGRPVRGLVSSDALEAVLGIDHEPSAWLQGFIDHQATIVDAARRCFQHQPGPEPVLVREEYFLEALQGPGSRS